MGYAFSTKSREHMAGVDARLIKIAERAIEITRIDFGIPSSGGVRSAALQRKLFDENRSQRDGTTKRSKHQDGIALDVYAYVDGSASWEKGHLAQVAAAMLQAANEYSIPIRWGGLWANFPDYPHFELTNP